MRLKAVDFAILVLKHRTKARKYSGKTSNDISLVVLKMKITSQLRKVKQNSSFLETNQCYLTC